MNQRRWLQVGGAAGVLSVLLQFGFKPYRGRASQHLTLPQRPGSPSISISTICSWWHPTCLDCRCCVFCSLWAPST